MLLTPFRRLTLIRARRLAELRAAMQQDESERGPGNLTWAQYKACVARCMYSVYQDAAHEDAELARMIRALYSSKATCQ